MEPDAVVPTQEDVGRAEESERVESAEEERGASQSLEDEGSPDQPVESEDARDGSRPSEGEGQQEPPQPSEGEDQQEPPQPSEDEDRQEPPQPSEGDEQQEKPFPWRPLVVVGMIVIAAVLAAVFLPKSRLHLKKYWRQFIRQVLWVWAVPVSRHR